MGVNTVVVRYQELCDKKSDINEHLPVLRRYASECGHVTELGVRWIVSTWALLAATPKTLISYDIRHPKTFGGNLQEVEDEAKRLGVDFKFIEQNSLLAKLEETDLLFIDTHHIYKQLKGELEKHAEKVRKYIILHDTTTFGYKGEDGGEGLKKALNEFLEGNLLWGVEKEYINNNGLTILKRGVQKPRKMTVDKDEREVVFQVKRAEAAPVVQPTPPQKKIKFIIPCPDVPYYMWQVLVQVNNLQKYGYDVEAHYPVCFFNGVPSDHVMSFIKSKDIKAKFHLYPDLRQDKTYTASIKPWLMYQYFLQYPQEKNTVYVYLDPDVIFLKKIDFSVYANDDIWYESDTRSYLDSKYIKSKGEQLFIEMCKIAGIPPMFIEMNDENCGGAQYVIKNNTPQLWGEIYKTSILLYKHMMATLTKYHPKGHDHPIQAWTAEMWATNWMAWKNNIKTKVIRELDFHWANHPMKDKKHSIFHNAGVAKDDGTNLCKVSYQSSPFRKKIKCKPQSLSYLYVKEIRNTEERFSDLIWD